LNDETEDVFAIKPDVELNNASYKMKLLKNPSNVSQLRMKDIESSV